MPMVLRSRRSNRVELEPTPRRRSTRPYLNRRYEEADESEPEATPSQVMERQAAELEEEAAEDTDHRELKGCRVVLDPLHIDERTQRKEIDEKEDMNRKGGKPVSRIPTYQKRPGSGGQAAERPGSGSPQRMAGERPGSRSPQQMGSGSQATERMRGRSQAAERMAGGSQAAERMAGGIQAAERMAGGSQAAEKMAGGSQAAKRMAGGSQAAERMAGESLAAERMAGGSLAAGRMAGESLAAERMGGSQAAERMAGGSQAAERMAGESQAAERMPGESQAAERMAGESQAAERMAGGSQAAERMAGGSQAAERMAGESLAAERMAGGSLAAGRMAGESLAAERMAGGSQAAERMAGGSQAAERMAGESQAAERMPGESQAAERMAGESQAAERMAGGSQAAERMAGGSQAAERMAGGSRAAEQMAGESQATERMAGGSQAADPPSPRKDGPIHVVKPFVRAGSASMETLKSKLPEVGESALPPPSVHVPSFVTPSMSGKVEQAATADHTSSIAAPKTKSISEFTQGAMIASPRPPLRPEQDMNKRSKTKVGITPEGLLSSILQESVLSLKPDEKHPGMTLSACGDTEKSEEKADVAVVEQTECIMEEEPPWEPVKATESRSSRSSSNADLATERSKGNESEDIEEHQEPLESQTKLPDCEVEEPCMDDSASYVEPKKAASGKTTQSTKRSMCAAVSLFLLLLVGGLGLHVWLYGLPTSVAQLATQLELHRLEGIGLVPEHCGSDCRVQLVESIPVGLYPSSLSPGPSIADSWLRLLNEAKSSVNIAAFYFTLRDSDVQSANPSDFQGRKVFEQLKKLESRGVKLQIAVNAPQTSTQDTAELSAAGAQVREVNLSAVTGGIVHTKLWIVDQKHFYLGSANMDWRSLSQVKEVGLSVEDCSCLAQDAFRLFGVYWAIGGAQSGSLPPFWPARLSALSSADNPLDLKFNGVPAQVYLSSAPPPISARGRSDDLSTILSVIDDAQRFIHISVMDYLPLSQYTEPVQFWPAIDSRLRAAACTRGVQVRLMVSCWEHSPASMFIFLQSLLVLSRAPLQCNVDVKIFTVPSTEEQMKIPFARVNHAKYMVTDRVLYIGTSNWSQNYFTHTAGVGLVVNQTGSAVNRGQQTLASQAEQLFLRDWDSRYASQLRVDDLDVCPRRRSSVHS
ncbi:uncharacterized protein pld7 isoform X2 [Poeciliopsis prolifica]|uniref:uncharacterized protein pld7 isoform X2 n=1 Tax=Poeciliopsis prolifica TaxID=188132 RepID=UPI002413A93D|nr:uncharacterized protein pld7 isoform X2 [Poeciliopsis prolifica]